MFLIDLFPFISVDDLEYMVCRIYCILFEGVYVMKRKRGLQLQNEIYIGN